MSSTGFTAPSSAAMELSHSAAGAPSFWIAATWVWSRARASAVSPTHIHGRSASHTARGGVPRSSAVATSSQTSIHPPASPVAALLLTPRAASTRRASVVATSSQAQTRSLSPHRCFSHRARALLALQQCDFYTDRHRPPPASTAAVLFTLPTVGASRSLAVATSSRAGIDPPVLGVADISCPTTI